MKTIIVACILALSSQVIADTQVFIFAGQSNISWDIKPTDFNNYQNGSFKNWLDSPNNDVIYTYERHLTSGVDESNGWIPLDTVLNVGQTHPSHERIGQEHIFAWRVTEYLRSIGNTDKIGIIKTQKSASSIASQWNPGGRDSKPLVSSSPYNEGYMHEALINRVTTSLANLNDPYTVEGFVWWQGEGDVPVKLWSEYYRLWLDDLTTDWSHRTEWWDLNEDGNPDYAGIPEDDISEYNVGLRELTGFNFPTLLTRISWNIGGSPKWGDRSLWEIGLINIRNAMDDFADDDLYNSISINIDDLPLADGLHYASPEYIEVGERYAWEYLKETYDILKGDINFDGIVDVADLALTGNQWGTSGVWPFNSDLNSDGFVDVADLALVGKDWDQGGLVSLNLIPSPASSISGLIMMLIVFVRPKR